MDGMTRLDELLSDPMVQLVMARDRVEPDEIRQMLERKNRHAPNRKRVPPAHVVSAFCGQSACL